MFVRLQNLGQIGVIHDTVGEALPAGAFTDALNMRFTGIEMQKMLEPSLFQGWDLENQGQPNWMQTWADGLSTYMCVASSTGLWVLRDNDLTTSWVNLSRPEGYSTEGYWDSFAWGNTVIFNNGIDPPQIWNSDTSFFEDLPGWGMLSTADDILNNDPPSRKVVASCVKLAPYKTFLVACGVSEGGLYHPNKIWWSDTTSFAGYDGAPNWDYETPASLSGQVVIDPEGGPVITAELLNEQLIIYNAASATGMLFTGGSQVMQFRRLFNKGAAGLHTVCEFNNQHFAVSQDQIYIHDGSTVQLIAKDRVEEEFFQRIGKGGRFGSGDVDWDGIQVVKNPDRKEIIVGYIDPVYQNADNPPSTCIPVYITGQPVDQNAGAGTVTFEVMAEGTAPITYQWFENDVLMEGETSSALSVPDTSTATYYAVLGNPCGSTQTNVVTVIPSEVCIPVAITQQPTLQEV